MLFEKFDHWPVKVDMDSMNKYLSDQFKNLSCWKKLKFDSPTRIAKAFINWPYKNSKIERNLFALFAVYKMEFLIFLPYVFFCNTILFFTYVIFELPINYLTNYVFQLGIINFVKTFFLYFILGKTCFFLFLNLVNSKNDKFLLR